MFLDEIFAVGDFKFQEKAVKIFEKSWIEGKTVVLISQSMERITKYCQRVAYIQQGELVHVGPPEETIAMYLEDDNLNAAANLALFIFLPPLHI